MNLLPAFLTTGRASCTSHDPDLFTSCTPDHIQQAKRICLGCPLRLACQTWAVDHREPVGVWGGLTPSERAQLHHGPGWWVDEEGRIREPCGSEAAKRAHHKHSENPCDTCTAGHEQRIEQRRRAILDVEHALPAGGSVRGYDTHRRLGEDACVPCKAAKARASAGKPERTAAGRTELPSSGPMALAS